MNDNLKRKAESDSKKIQELATIATAKGKRSGSGNGTGGDRESEEQNMKSAKDQHIKTMRTRANADAATIRSLRIISEEQMPSIYLATLPNESKWALGESGLGENGSDNAPN